MDGVGARILSNRFDLLMKVRMLRIEMAEISSTLRIADPRVLSLTVASPGQKQMKCSTVSTSQLHILQTGVSAFPIL